MKLNRRGLIAFCAAVPWICGPFFHDTWFRPWSSIIAICAIVTLIILIMAMIGNRYGKIAAAIPSILLIFLGATLGFPASSHYYGIEIRNSRTVPIEVTLKRLDKRRFKNLSIAPSSKVRFMYFLGDGGSPIPCDVTTTETLTGRTFTQPVTIRVKSRVQKFVINSDLNFVLDQDFETKL